MDKICPAFPSSVGSVSVYVPAAAFVVKVTVPDVVPLRLIVPVDPPAVPIVIALAKVGLVPNTSNPLPVSSEITPASSAEVVAAKADNLLADVANVPDVGRVTLVVPVDVSVIELAPDVASVDPFASVRVAPLAGCVIVILLTLVAVATPRIGVVRVGLVPNTKAPVPVSSVMTDASCADVVGAKTLKVLLVVTWVAVESEVCANPL